MQAFEYRAQLNQFDPHSRVGVDVLPPGGENEGWVLHSITPAPTVSFESVTGSIETHVNSAVFRETSRSRYTDKALFLFTWMRPMPVLPNQNTY